MHRNPQFARPPASAPTVYAALAASALAVGTLAALIIFAPPADATDPAEMPDFLGEHGPRAQLLLLGTFHFRDAGLDSHKPQHAFDALSERRQKEIGAVLDMLADWHPTKIAVEVKREGRTQLDADYAAYRNGGFELSPREVHQIAFRLAKRLHHDRLYAVDAERRYYEPDRTREEYEAHAGRLMEGVPPSRIRAEEALGAQFMKMYDWEDAQLDGETLQQHWRFLNDPETLRRHHGHYLIGSFKLGRDEDYLGADVQTSWYNRNLRIFQILTRITDGPTERILLLIGAGHVPILRHAALASPDYELVEVADVIAAPATPPPAADDGGAPPPPSGPRRVDTR